MIEPLAFGLVVLTGALAVFGVISTVRNRPPERTLVRAVGVVEALLLVQALLGLLRVLGGARPAETSTFLIYLGVSVCLLPVTLQFARAEPTKWGGTVIAVGAVAAGVVVLRLLSLWGTAGA